MTLVTTAIAGEPVVALLGRRLEEDELRHEAGEERQAGEREERTGKRAGEERRTLAHATEVGDLFLPGHVVPGDDHDEEREVRDDVARQVQHERRCACRARGRRCP